MLSVGEEDLVEGLSSTWLVGSRCVAAGSHPGVAGCHLPGRSSRLAPGRDLQSVGLTFSYSYAFGSSPLVVLTLSTVFLRSAARPLDRVLFLFWSRFFQILINVILLPVFKR